jgi:hypothetical protein
MKKIFNKTNLRKLRRIYAYLVGGGFTAFFAVYDIPESTQGKFYFWIGLGAVIIQAANDSSKEPLPNLPHNKIN